MTVFHNLRDIADVDDGYPEDGQVLTWNAKKQKWTFGPAGGVVGSKTSTQWRVVVQSSAAGQFIAIGELQFRTVASIPDVPAGGVAIEDADYSSHPAANAFDGNPATAWINDSIGHAGGWVGYQFAVSRIVVEVMITARQDAFGSYAQSPTSFVVQRYDPVRGNWTADTAFSTFTPTGWSNGETRTFSLV